MFFNSIEFALFLPLVFTLYWLVNNKNLKLQNAFILLASYVFYGWWDWRFLFLVAFSSGVDYLIGLKLHASDKSSQRKLLLALSLIVNLGFLAFFKYFNFFVQSFSDAFTLLGKPINVDRLNIILPVGISFYTFQTLSYTIDIYRKKLEPSRCVISFFAFVSFFPQLVAGPIERASNLLPQFAKKRQFNYEQAVNGLRQILWGLFKKVVIADNCADFANKIFESPEIYDTPTLIMGAICFGFQIYGDFSGYSDIAIGISRLFGFNLMRNFGFPYFSRDIAEFWRRWHISLSTWFRDYLYIPLGGSLGSKWQQIRNIFIVFIVSGFWHGANWTFIAWGALNALYFLPLLLTKKNRYHTGLIADNRKLPSIKEALQIIVTFFLITLSWVFFRADSLTEAFNYLGGIFTYNSEAKSTKFHDRSLAFLILFIIIEWIGRHHQYALEKLGLGWHRSARWALYYLLIIIIIFYGGKPQEFIYFQF